MKKAFIAICAGFFLAAASPALAGKIGYLQNVQQARIHQGAASGQLTPKEVRTLKKQQARIQKTRALAWADGHVNRHERHEIRAMQNRASYKIRALGHNRNRCWKQAHGQHSFLRVFYAGYGNRYKNH